MLVEVAFEQSKGAQIATSASMIPQGNLTWADEAMRELQDEIQAAGQTDASVMLTGETGVGKRYAANMIHQLSRRMRAPFVAINAAAMTTTTAPAESDSADAGVPGFLQAAEDGTLLIQDIEKLPSQAQSQLIEFMDRTAKGKRPVRLMTSTTTHLFKFVEGGELRDDLYYRLNMIRLTIPPLRERRADIPVLFRHYLSHYAGNDVPRISNAARERLMEYAWPGNIAELTSVVKTIGASNLPVLIDLEHLPSAVVECQAL
jgi:DNA-binding NtrC family response regulator